MGRRPRFGDAAAATSSRCDPDGCSDDVVVRNCRGLETGRRRARDRLAFFFFLTIPGWIALSRYRKWKRDEITTPFGLIWWGYGFGALVVFTMVMSSFS